MNQPSDELVILWEKPINPAVVNGKFERREDDSIEARYTRYEFALCCGVMGLVDEAIKELERMDKILGWEGE